VRVVSGRLAAFRPAAFGSGGTFTIVTATTSAPAGYRFVIPPIRGMGRVKHLANRVGYHARLLRTAQPNTLNVCLGHVAFPAACRDYVDLMIAPRPIAGVPRLQVVDDSLLGDHGSSLSEYAQLLWLHDHLDAVTAGYHYVRIFQYRRFVARRRIGSPCSHEWSRRIAADELPRVRNEFQRGNVAELFSHPHRFRDGMLGQYAASHELEDMFNFAKYLLEAGILNARSAAAFVAAERTIPSASTGTFKVTTLRDILAVLKQAAGFLHSGHFVPREGYQRRSLGFLLERLHGHLILTRTARGLSEPNFGHQTVISDDHDISITT
jgi:hypothetical protein